MCSRSCSGGETVRVRTCLNPKSKNPNSNCVGPANETKPCNTAICAVPVKCKFGEATGGKKLIGNLFINQAIQFGYSEIEAQEKCIQFREICQGYATEFLNGFRYYVLKTSSVNKQERTSPTPGWFMLCTENPEWSKWSTWYACSVTCGGGSRTRTRFCDGAEAGSEMCKGPETQIDECNSGRCPGWSAWSQWTGCSTSCNQGFQERSRQCVGDYPDACGDLQGPANQTQRCSKGNCPYWSPWSEWSLCDKTCGDGTQKRTRDCKGDFQCPENDEAVQTKTCSLGECQFWYEWSQWSDCSITCGEGGDKTRARECGGDFRELCKESEFSEVKSCSVNQECPKWTNWTEWSDCSVTCGIGEKRRRQTCAAEILRTCGDVDIVDGNYSITRDETKKIYSKSEVLQCTYGICSYWEKWGAWGACSSTCDEGTRVRSRSCFGDLPKMCSSSGKSVESEACTLGSCGVWGAWSTWGECSQTCGSGTWERIRKCLGDFTETCVGQASETSSCDVGDCVPQCDGNPCNNAGQCRFNDHLARQYHCRCPEGWIGKHCDYLGPEIVCDADRIRVWMDSRVLSDELLPAEVEFVALSGFNDVSECGSTELTAINSSIEFYSLTVPAPLDVSCGSDMEIGEDEIRITNRVEWTAEDDDIEAQVILLEFTCAYRTVADVSATDDVRGVPLKISTFKKSIDITNGTSNFGVAIALFRDPTFKLPIRADFGSLLQLAEGQVIYVSVDLKRSNVADDVDVKLVMNTCFVTSSVDSKSADNDEQRPFLYLLKNRCPVSPFVRVISNGEGKSGLLSVRVFGWTGKNLLAENLYLHCTVEICQSEVNECKQVCKSSTRGRRDLRVYDRDGISPVSRTDRDTIKPHTSIFKRVNVGEPHTTRTKKRDVDVDVKYMVSAGPIRVKLETDLPSEKFPNDRGKLHE